VRDLVPDLYAEVERQASLKPVVGQSFVVVGTDDEQVARNVGPLVAHAVRPERRWGEVLHVERTYFGWEVVVQDHGARRF